MTSHEVSLFNFKLSFSKFLAYIVLSLLDLFFIDFFWGGKYFYIRWDNTILKEQNIILRILGEYWRIYKICSQDN